VDRDHAAHRLRGRCFVRSANQFATRDDYPSDYPLEDSGDDAGDVLCRGGSVIVSPLGDVLAGPAFGEETVLRADLDFDRIAEVKYDFDVVGHYARPDVFTLTVDERPRPAVVELDA
jgi:nitrilase